MAAVALLIAATLTPSQAARAEEHGFLETIRRHIMQTSTGTDNGDLNPYAIVVAPVSGGNIHKDDVRVTNFNNLSNLQGIGGTIVDFSPLSRKTTLFATLPRRLPRCPGGIDLGTAMTMLKTGCVIVGSTLSTDGATRTDSAGTGRVLISNDLLKRPGAMCFARNCDLLVTNAETGQVVEVDPRSCKQLCAQWVDSNRAQSRPGNGDLFGTAMTPDGSGFYYVEDDVNTLMEAAR